MKEPENKHDFGGFKPPSSAYKYSKILKYYLFEHMSTANTYQSSKKSLRY